MKLDEIKVDWDLIRTRDPIFKELWVAVPRGTLWQKDIKAIWTFKSAQDAQQALRSPVAGHVQDVIAGDDLVSMTTMNNVHVIMSITSSEYSQLRGYCRDMGIDLPIPLLAVSITESSARKAGEAALSKLNLGSMLWVYKTWALDSSIFSYTEDELE